MLHRTSFRRSFDRVHCEHAVGCWWSWYFGTRWRQVRPICQQSQRGDVNHTIICQELFASMAPASFWSDISDYWNTIFYCEVLLSTTWLLSMFNQASEGTLWQNDQLSHHDSTETSTQSLGQGQESGTELLYTSLVAHCLYKDIKLVFIDLCYVYEVLFLEIDKPTTKKNNNNTRIILR